MSKGKEIAKTAVILFLITAVSAALLAAVNGITAPLIAENEEKTIQEALKVVMPDADEFEEKEKDEAAKAAEEKYGSEILNLYDAKAGGEVVGLCAIVETKGYSAGLTCAVGVDADGVVTGVEITAHEETPGLGANAEDEGFRNQYIGKHGEIGVAKNNAGDNEITAMSGATMTSNGVTNAVNTVTAAAARENAQ
ncbi:MAG TPA: RnfABCDGE type electron transport complex subunit G [Candidatus Ornithomonoglobus intestinigallinarum]|uniref:Ion-translocating oxidoreductase complex subunit G n=1 Tax=Candidatus Ornithomonoglobus intestinigallinarum TaxID=2840894 RepID=A0A9D1H1X2_9FIRM|nr:RnfABCDGE type electron transport complex subunit G [Candidatus Ornithomonoglobus intestinigallinarum]